MSRSLLVAVLLLAGCASNQSNDVYWEKSDLEEAARLNTQIGIELARSGDLERAQEKLEKAIGQDSRYPVAHQTLALVHMWGGDLEASEESFIRALRLDEGNPETLNNYGSLLCRQQRYDEAHEQFSAAVADRRYATPDRAYLNAGVCAMQAQNRERAENSFRSILKLNPRHAGALLELVRLNHHFGQYIKARAFMQRLEDVVPKVPPSALLLAAKVELSLRNRAGAKQYAEKIRLQYPDSPELIELIDLNL